MFDSPILNIAITLSFTYFIVSLIVSSFNEFVYSFISRRGTMLKQAIEDLFFDQGEWKKFVHTEIFKNPQIESLQKKPGQFPSYIPAKNFAGALLDSMRKDGQLLDMNAVREAILNKDGKIPEPLKCFLRTMFEKADGDLQKFQTEIESFYNNAMDRVTGWYKRETSYVIFSVAFMICIAGNIDTINVINKLWSDPAKLEATTDQIIGLSKKINYSKDSNQFSYHADSGSFAGISGSYEVIKKDSISGTESKLTVNLDNAIQAGKIFSSSGIPLGWSDGNGFQKHAKGNFCTPVIEFFIKLAGWLITAIAVMLGAPFWFDLMNKFISLRGTGKKPDENANAVGTPAQPITVNIHTENGAEAVG